MSCTSPKCYLIPRAGGRPKPLMEDYPIGQTPLGRIVYLPCGGCIACRRERRQELTLLQCCEASLHEDNWFITLTYDDWKIIELTGMPPYSLNRKHLSSFCESMRKYCRYLGADFRFFACGEYGERYQRPHYHLSVFGLSPFLLGIDDFEFNINERKKGLAHGKLYKNLQTPSRDSNGNAYWQSRIISDRWPYGAHKIYRANRETYQYVAGYVTKKLTGERGKEFRASGRASEFQAQSRPSIGWPWFIKFQNSISQIDCNKLINDAVSISGLNWKCPRIFDKWYSSVDPFNGPVYAQLIKDIRTENTPLIPDRRDLKRKADFDLYSVKRYQDNNRSHMEIK